MAADWSLLTEYLSTKGDQVTVSWDELGQVVGGVPASALDHPAWWSGDRPHTRAWRAAGFEVIAKRPGHSVTFARASRPRPDTATPRSQPASPQPVPETTDRSDLLLVTCVKTKLDVPAPAKDLYVSTLFERQRAYAEAKRVPWYILSAEYGLLRPDDWVAPYERYLPDTSRSYRDAWGAWVVERLALLEGDLRGKRVEVHASRDYVRAIEGALAAKGAIVFDPLAGLAHGQRLAWYGARRAM